MYCGTQQARMTPTRVLEWNGFHNLDSMASFSHDLPKSNFSKKVQTLTNVITWLESNHKVRFTMDLHNLVKKQSKWTVAPMKEVAFKMLDLDEARKEKPNEQNAASLLKVHYLSLHWGPHPASTRYSSSTSPPPPFSI
jgi:hypothetical protein